jgi:hypothetical protein
MVGIVAELFPWLDGGELADHTVSLYGNHIANVVRDDPFSAFNCDGQISVIMDADKVNKAVWAISRSLNLWLIKNAVNSYPKVWRLEEIAGRHAADSKHPGTNRQVGNPDRALL